MPYNDKPANVPFRLQHTHIVSSLYLPNNEDTQSRSYFLQHQ